MESPSSMKDLTVAQDVLGAIGQTPLIRLPASFAPEVSCEILLKLEFLNPTGSTKDRIALNMVRRAEERGDLKAGGRIVECSSGNTGAGLCMVGAALGYAVTIVIPDKMSQEKIAAIRALGAEVVITPANVEIEDERHYTKVAERIAREDPSAWWPNQYHNTDNTQAHEIGTGAEILEQCGTPPDAFVAGAGTGGTLSGIARALKNASDQTKIVGVDPPGSILADYWRTGELVTPGPYAVEGVGEEEVPGAWEPELIDDYLVISDEESFHMARKLARETGIFGGGSSGMNLAAALKVGASMPPGSRIVTVLPDSGKAYLSKVYDDGWMKDCGYLPPVPATTATVGELLRDKEQSTVDVQETLTWAVRQAAERGVRPLPLLDAGNLAGVLDEAAAADLLAQGKDLQELKAGDCIQEAPPLFAYETPWTELIPAMQRHHAVLVQNALGITSMDRRDWLRALARIDHNLD